MSGSRRKIIYEHLSIHSSIKTRQVKMPDEKDQFANTNDSAAIDMDDSMVKLFPNGEKNSNFEEISFTGLGKEELMRYADDPFWKKVRLVLFIICWVGWIAMLAATIIIIVLAPRCPYRPDQKWYDKETVYQVYPKSFKDSTPEDITDPAKGAGVGDINGKGNNILILLLLYFLIV